MSFKGSLFFVFAMIALASCANQSGSDMVGKTVITMSDFKKVHVETPFEMFAGEPKFVRVPSKEGYSFSKAFKVEYINDKIYILDQNHYRLVVFEDSGAPVFKLDYKGRGPNEYLQITDFAVAPDGSLWVADAQKDRMFKYSAQGVMQESEPFHSEVVRMCALNDNQLLIGIASYDITEYAGTALALADSTAKIQKPVLPYPERTDPNYWFSSVISRGENGVFYNWPVDDNLYEISYDGELLNTYYFDFGAKTVPMKWRKDLEPHESQLPEYRFLTRSFKVTPEYVICAICNSVDWASVIMDREKKTIAYFDDKTSGYTLIGQYPYGSIWRIDPTCDGTSLPEEVQGWLEDGDDVLALIPIE